MEWYNKQEIDLFILHHNQTVDLQWVRNFFRHLHVLKGIMVMLIISVVIEIPLVALTLLVGEKNRHFLTWFHLLGLSFLALAFLFVGLIVIPTLLLGTVTKPKLKVPRYNDYRRSYLGTLSSVGGSAVVLIWVSMFIPPWGPIFMSLFDTPLVILLYVGVYTWPGTVFLSLLFPSMLLRTYVGFFLYKGGVEDFEKQEKAMFEYLADRGLVEMKGYVQSPS